MDFDLTWRVLLLGAVLVADLLAFLNLVANELREWQTNGRSLKVHQEDGLTGTNKLGVGWE